MERRLTLEYIKYRNRKGTYMKKSRNLERVFAIALVVCMVITMLPTNAIAAVQNMTKHDATNLESNESNAISWPIQIYDYLNDGMLFEYAGANGDGKDFALLDDEGRYVYIPDMNTDYVADYTQEESYNSYVTKYWFDQWGIAESGYKKFEEPITGLPYLEFSTHLSGGGAELIDFRTDSNGNGILDYYETTSGDGTSAFDNAYGYTFKYDAYNPTWSEDIKDKTFLVDSSLSEYEFSTFKWWARIQLIPVDGNDYKVGKIYMPGEEVSEKLGDNEYWLLVHASASGAGNWMDLAAAKGIHTGDIVRVTIPTDENYNTQTVTVLSPAEGKNPASAAAVSKDGKKYAVLVYKISGLDDADVTMKAFLRREDNLKEESSTEIILSNSEKWVYQVFNFADTWDSVPESLRSAGISVSAESDDSEYQFDISHFAFFETEGQARAYGEKALVYNNHYIFTREDLTVPDMTTNYLSDFTKSGMTNSLVTSYWFNVWNIVHASVKSKDETTYANYSTYEQTAEPSEKVKYYQFSDLTEQKETIELMDLSQTGFANRENNRFVLLVYRLDITANESTGANTVAINAFVRGETTYDTNDYGPRDRSYKEGTI